ncbi:MAG TPA: tannase/feruloyl esterase family alpha/beta hydrolase [Steroidobacteraceae bacterium]|nr:tannase/feruloyl esterase family alpha/beta hydrolase [Steroidobacteraceae bacterium]
MTSKVTAGARRGAPPLARLYLMAGLIVIAAHAQARSPRNLVPSCDAAGIGAVTLRADGVKPTITSVSTGKAGNVTYCLVKVLVPKAINIWVGLPMGGAWNGRWQSEGGGVYAGAANVPASLRDGYAAATTDTGHSTNALSGAFGMLEPGKPNVELQTDFATRSEHMMAVIGKQLVKQFYGVNAKYSYWNGCSTGGRQGLRMAQDHPGDYDGILAGAPAIHWDRFQAAMLWYPVVAQRDNGGPVGGGDRNAMSGKYRLATDHAVAACDMLDGVKDGLLTDPRKCHYSAAADATITRSSCTASDASCLTPTEATAIDDMWLGPVTCAKGEKVCKAPDVASRDLGGKGAKRMWYGIPRGADLGSLAGAAPFPVVPEQSRYWVYFDPTWDWKSVNADNFLQYFKDNVTKVGPMMATDNPDLSAFRKRGGKLVIWHGWADQLIDAMGSVDYYQRVVDRMGGLKKTQEFARLFMAPGVGHCGGGNGPAPQHQFDAVVNWVEKGIAPDTITAARVAAPAGGFGFGALPGGAPPASPMTRPLCPYPAEARWNGKGPTDDAASFSCAAPGK